MKRQGVNDIENTRKGKQLGIKQDRNEMQLGMKIGLEDEMRELFPER